MLVVDGHVHFYPNFCLNAFLESACKNMDSAGKNGKRILLLSESYGHNFFKELPSLLKTDATASELWRLDGTSETFAMRLSREGFEDLIVIAGRQIVAKEKLEVQALGTLDRFEDHKYSAEDLIKMIADIGAIPVIPWGAGKWFGKRGAILAGLIKNCKVRFFLGDNSGRPWFWKEPSHFALARRYGLNIIAGSDPLPVAGGERTVGRCGFVVEDCPEEKGYFAAVRSGLSKHSPILYGKREKLMSFVLNQTAMQLRKKGNLNLEK